MIFHKEFQIGIRQVKNSIFVRHVLALLTGAVIAQFLSLIASPLLTRLYKPADFGLFSIYMSIANVFCVMVTGRYQMAVMLPKKTTNAANIFIFSFFIAFCFSVLLVIGVLFFEKYDGEMKYLPITVFMFGVCQLIINWLNREREYVIISKLKIVQSFMIASFSLIFGFLGWGYKGFILADVLSSFIVCMYFGNVVFKYVWPLKYFIKIRRIKKLAKRYIEFPTINMSHALGDVAQSSGVVFLISAIYGSATLGFYAFGLRVLRAPVSIMGGAIAQVFFQYAIKNYNSKKSLRPLFDGLIKKLLILSLIPFSILFLFSDSIFSIIFGADWLEAGVFVQILSPWLFMNFIASTLSQIPMIVGQQKNFFLLSTFGNVMVLVVFLMGGVLGIDIQMTLKILTVFMSVHTIFVVFWMRSICKE